MILIARTPTATVAVRMTIAFAAARAVDLGDTAATTSYTPRAAMLHHVRCVDDSAKLPPTVMNVAMPIASNRRSAVECPIATPCTTDAAIPVGTAASACVSAAAAVSVATAAAAQCAGEGSLRAVTTTTTTATATGCIGLSASALQNTSACSRPPATIHADATAMDIAVSICGMQSDDYEAWCTDFNVLVLAINESVRCGDCVLERISALQSGSERWTRTGVCNFRAAAIVRSGRAYIPRTKFPKISRSRYRMPCGRQ